MPRTSLNSVDLWHYERLALSDGYQTVAGIDEAGRGPLAGPVVAAAVILPTDCCTDGINDSKQLSEKQRENAFQNISRIALAIGVGRVDVDEIDAINILQATYNAMRKAIVELSVQADLFLIDGSPIKDFGYPHRCIVKGDGKSASIAAASIIAKVTRDRLMCEYDADFPEYGFARHKGYSTKEHLNKIALHGICAIHRKSFSPVTEELNKVWRQTKLL